MNLLRLRSLLVAAVCLGAGSLAAAAQQQPSAPPAAGNQARQVQAAIQNSGLTLDQIRSRLKAEGYSERLLDSYYSGAPTGTPSDEVFGAIKALGLSDAADSTKKRAAGKDENPRTRNEIEREFLDTVAVAAKDEQVRAAILSVLHSRDTMQAKIDSGFAVFGLDVFNRETTLFDANDVGPVPADYRIGPGDELVLVLTGDTEHSYELPVTREGMVFIPNVGAVPVANLSMTQLNDLLYSRLSRVYSGISRGPGATTHFQITVGKLGSSQVSVLGDVAQPGAYRISKLGTVLTALYSAGGPTASGNMRRVEVRRAGRLLSTLDLYDYLVTGSTANDIQLESGDVVLVPARGARVRLAGAVVRPATYELTPTETLGDLIRLAGGFRPEADRRRVQIERILPPEKRTASGKDRELFDVAGARLEDSKEPLLSGDIVRVVSIAPRFANRVRVTGNVWSPGAVALTAGMRISDAIAKAGGVRSDTYREALQIARLQPDSTRKLLRVSVPAAGSNSPDDLFLQADDEIRVFSLSEYRPIRFVSVSGRVGKSGRYPYRDGMTVRDLLMLAGGLKEGALLSEAEVARMPTERANGATAVTIRVPLDSTYLFDRPPGAPYQGPPGLASSAHSAPEFELKAYDNLLILAQPDWLLPRTVTIHGEVVYPGTYTLRSKSERLADLVARAGGLTRDAYPEGIVFIRQADSVGRIGVDLPDALKNRSSQDNLLLADGDSIEIPFHSSTVTVTGAVNSPVSVPYVPGENLEYYIYAAGGPTARGDASKAFVTQPSGKVESPRKRVFWTSKPTPQPGSTVSVPTQIDGGHIDVAAALTATTSILTSIVALAAILRR